LVDCCLTPTLAIEFYELGLGEPQLISAEHGQGIGDLIDYTLVDAVINNIVLIG
jgi:predicted GTPase